MASPNYGNMYAKHGHDHDLVYSKHTHNHDNDYSKIYHNHDGVYAQKSHNHDGTYSPTSHNHNGTYLPLTGGTVNGDVRAAHFRCGNHEYARFGYQESSGDVFIANSQNSWLRLKPDNTMTMAGKNVLIDQGRQVLWEGGLWMMESHTVTPSKPLANCQNGWVLIFGDYDPSTSKINAYNYVFHYVHKNVYLSGKNMLAVCATDGGAGKDVVKTIYVNNTTIKGHAGNSGSTEQDDVILQYVLEW